MLRLLRKNVNHDIINKKITRRKENKRKERKRKEKKMTIVSFCIRGVVEYGILNTVKNSFCAFCAFVRQTEPNP